MPEITEINSASTPTNLFSVPDLIAQRTTIRDVHLYPYQSAFVAKELMDIANALVHPRGKGIYATDETPDAMESVFDAAMGNDHHGISEKEEMKWTEEQHRERRKKWREFAYTIIPAEYVSGVILYAETLHDFHLGPLLTDRGIIPGVRANGELAPIPVSTEDFRAEFRVQGLDDLLIKMQRARAAGARFSKWRVQIACSSAAVGLPSQLSLDIQANTLAQFAAISQEAGLVPVVEPDIMFDGDADLTRSTQVHEKAISLIYERMKAHGVLLEGSLIKPSFPQPGLKHPSRSNVLPEDIALATLTVISRTVSAAVPGVAFLSGGLPPAVATQYLAAVNALVNSSAPGTPFARLPRLTFSFGRALQGDALKYWVKDDEKAAKFELEKWARSCWHAARGEVI
ncbi:aldolase [Cyathus striatus]|nr:aldolase [Cyathus striatus]